MRRRHEDSCNYGYSGAFKYYYIQYQWHPVDSHFRDTTKMVTAGVAARAVKDYKLTRYACYLIAQNGDSNKQEIALAQAYFAVQTRRFY